MPTVWSQSDRFVPRRFVRPLQSFMHTEASGGMVMLAAAVLALVWANSPWSASYHTLWETHLDVHLGDLIHLDLSLEQWVNDGLMVIFFFVVGMEIKRELVIGELRDPRAAALPAIAAVGGMIVPAIIYMMFNAGGEGADGWGIPMATDIAFAVGVVSLVGNRITAAAKLFLLALAIVDDLGAILVIAVFYTSGLSFGWLASSLLAFAVVYVLQRMRVRSIVPYIALGVFAWVAMHESGVHATITGVVMGLLTPTWSLYNPTAFRRSAMVLVDRIDRGYEGGDFGKEHEHADIALADLRHLAAETQSPLDRLEGKLHLWSSFVIIPIFALANAGVELTGDILADAPSNSIVLGVALGLLVGKSIGIFGATLFAVKTGIGRMPAYTTWADIFGLSMLAGVGFTVALFVAQLAFVGEPELLNLAKVGILAGSLLAGLIGYAFLRASAPVPDSAAANADDPGLHGHLPTVPPPVVSPSGEAPDASTPDEPPDGPDA